jgi:methylglutaconyl-CoA hydratase
MDNGYVKSSTKDGIATIEFYHPSHNSLPGNLLRAIEEDILKLGADNEVVLIILKSSGDRTFCAGASFTELSSIENKDDGKLFFMGFARVINAIRTCGKIVIGRVQGKAVGGGVGLAAACDYTMATRYASIRLSELAVGIGPFVIGPAVERKMGLSAFSQLALNPTEWQTAKWARRKGLFTEVFDTGKQLDNYIDHFTEKLVNMNPHALAELKNIFWARCTDWDELLEHRASLSGEMVMSSYAKKAIQKFLTA